MEARSDSRCGGGGRQGRRGGGHKQGGEVKLDRIRCEWHDQFEAIARYVVDIFKVCTKLPEEWHHELNLIVKSLVDVFVIMVHVGGAMGRVIQFYTDVIQLVYKWHTDVIQSYKIVAQVIYSVHLLFTNRQQRHCR